MATKTVTVVNPKRRTPPRNSKGRFTKRKRTSSRKRTTRRNPARYTLTNPKRKRRTYRRRTNPFSAKGLTNQAVNLATDGLSALGGYSAVNYGGDMVIPATLQGWSRIGAKAVLAVLLPTFAGKLLGAKAAKMVGVGAALAVVNEAMQQAGVGVPGAPMAGGAAPVEGYVPFEVKSLPTPAVDYGMFPAPAPRSGILQARV